MRKVVAALFISLDGVVQSPDQWQFDHFDEDMGTAMGAALAAQDAVLLGRVTYQEWAPYWPTATDEPFASYINATPKYVASTTLKTVTWQNSTLLTGDAVAAVARLRQQPGKNIVILGSGALVRSLLPHHLIDEYTLLIHPLVLGSGQRLFADGGAFAALRLVDARPTTTGVVIATYRPAER